MDLTSRGCVSPRRKTPASREKKYYIASMAQLTITARGQVTFKRDLLKHLGVKPGEKIDVVLLPNGRAELKAAKPARSIESFVGLLKGKSKWPLTIDEMNEVVTEGWTNGSAARRSSRLIRPL